MGESKESKIQKKIYRSSSWDTVKTLQVLTSGVSLAMEVKSIDTICQEEEGGVRSLKKTSSCHHNK